MAKRVSPLEPPEGPLQGTLIEWGEHATLYRVHHERFQGNAFNPTRIGNARFSPIFNASGDVIPTLYAGSTLFCALMETVFHDIPYKPCFKPLPVTRLREHVVSTIVLKKNLVLVDLGTVALHKLGIQRNQLIDTTKVHYPRTRRWAEALHRQFPKAQGLRWTSRQEDHAQAVMLFGDRVKSSLLTTMLDCSPLLDEDGYAIRPVLDLANGLGVTLISE
jgi:RES domain-containing protein